jgi:hypothetical protein
MVLSQIFQKLAHTKQITIYLNAAGYYKELLRCHISPRGETKKEHNDLEEYGNVGLAGYFLRWQASILLTPLYKNLVSIIFLITSC